MKKLEKFILQYFEGSENELFICLTYKKDVLELKEIKEDVAYFIRRIRRKYEKRKFIYAIKFERMDSRMLARSHSLKRLKK